jgi:hypothetical protein
MVVKFIGGIGIQKTNAGIGIPASVISVRYRSKKLPDCVALFRYRTGRGIVSFIQSGTGLTGCRTIRHSGMQRSCKNAPIFCNISQNLVLL